MVGGAVSSREKGPLLGTLPLPHSVLARLFEHGAAPRAQIFVIPEPYPKYSQWFSKLQGTVHCTARHARTCRTLN